MKKTVLYVANKKLPRSDYRIQFGRSNFRYRIVYALPAMTEGLDADQFVRMGFKEGLSISDTLHFAHLALYIARHRTQIDLVHFYSTKLILLGPLICAVLGVPSFITLTGLGRTFDRPGKAGSLLSRIYLVLFRHSAQRCARVLFQNRGHLEFMTRHFPDLARKFIYVGSAVDMRISTSKSYDNDVLRVLLVARLLPAKGIDDFLDAAHALRNEPVKFVLVGPPSRGFRELRDRVAACDRRQIISYKGELDTLATQDEYSNAQAFFFPSYGEGLARVMLECGFAGLCPIAYDIPANRDLVAEGRGFLVKTGDVDTAVAKLRELARNRGLLRRNALAYQQHITNSYSTQVFAQSMLATLEDVLG